VKHYDGTDFNRKIGAALADAEAGETVLVTNHTKPRAVLLSFDSYMKLANDAGVKEKWEVIREIREQHGVLHVIDDGNVQRSGSR
jgi:prevent-host-death family protein